MTITARIDIDPAPALVLHGDGTAPVAAELVGRRARVAATPQDAGGGQWSVELPLSAARWGSQPLPLPSGAYEVRLTDADGAVREVPATVPEAAAATLRARLDGDRLTVRPPIDPAYDSGEGQAALERRYATRPPGAELENAVFFESFYGRNASCNPRAIDRELARVAPGVTRYWSVVDLSVAVPEGAIPVIEGSPQWWRARGAARLLVVNDWLRRRYTRRPGQVVLQTWHGTPLKRLALHRPGFDPRRIVAVLRESRRWDVLLAQNAYGARILRKAYAFLRRPIWVEGYPRNDVLRTGDGRATRQALGIDPAERVILYAPTWRDDRDELIDDLGQAGHRRGVLAMQQRGRGQHAGPWAVEEPQQQRRHGQIAQLLRQIQRHAQARAHADLHQREVVLQAGELVAHMDKRRRLRRRVIRHTLRGG